jgi:O-antigen/teichoic acid export membrane protein
VVIANVATSLILTGLGVCASSLVSYGLGVNLRGVLGIFSLAISIAATIGSLGMAEALLVLLAGRGYPSGNTLIRKSILVVIGVSLAGVVAGGLVSWVFGGEGLGVSVLFTVSCAASTALWMLPNGLLLGQQAFGHWNVIRLLGGLGWLVAIGVGIALSGAGHDETTVLVGIGQSFAVCNVCVWLLALMFVRSKRRGQLTAKSPSARSLLAFGVPASLGLTVVLVNGRLDQVFVASNYDATVLGQYVAAASYCALLVVGVQALGNLAYPKIASQQEQRAYSELQKYARLAGSLSLYLSIPLWLLAPFAIALLNGPEFPDSASFARILLVGAAFQALSGVLEQGLKAIGLPREFLWAECLGLLSTFTLLAVAQQYGANWIAAASSAGSLITLLVVVAFLARAAPGITRASLVPLSPLQFVRVVAGRNRRSNGL